MELEKHMSRSIPLQMDLAATISVSSTILGAGRHPLPDPLAPVAGHWSMFRSDLSYTPIFRHRPEAHGGAPGVRSSPFRLSRGSHPGLGGT